MADSAARMSDSDVPSANFTMITFAVLGLAVADDLAAASVSRAAREQAQTSAPPATQEVSDGAATGAARAQLLGDGGATGRCRHRQADHVPGDSTGGSKVVAGMAAMTRPSAAPVVTPS